MSPVRYPPTLRPVIRSDDEPCQKYEWCKQKPKLTDMAADDGGTVASPVSEPMGRPGAQGSLFDVNDNGRPIPDYYNGFVAGEDVRMDDSEIGASALGIEGIAKHGVQGRGVLVDLLAPIVESRPRKEVGYKELMAVNEA